MAKYSTGSGGGGSGDSCELCGAADTDLRTATVAGATLQVCGDCVEHDDAGKRAGGNDGGSGDDRNRDRDAARNAARLQDAAAANPDWEDGAGYDDDQLPYLVRDYADRLTEARQAAGYQLGELAAEVSVDEADLLALEQGRATQAGVGGSTVAALEEFLDVDLVDE
jgi:ribosome-binding protein aMBF1 (putative translation factor)